MSRRTYLSALRAVEPVILPSMLMCDWARLQEDVARLEAAGAQALHLDVMDGHFVPNLSYGLTLVEAFAKMTRLPLEVHLMISNPADYVERYFEAGAHGMTIHAEAVKDPGLVLEKIRSLGAAAGLAINPPTPVDAIRPHLKLCDIVLVMSVMPGFGGQQFDPVALQKLRTLRTLVGPDVLLEIDGGINRDTIGPSVEAGVHLLVIGSAIFKHHDYQAAFADLTSLAHSHRGG